MNSTSSPTSSTFRQRAGLVPAIKTGESQIKSPGNSGNVSDSSQSSSPVRRTRSPSNTALEFMGSKLEQNDILKQIFEPLQHGIIDSLFHHGGDIDAIKASDNPKAVFEKAFQIIHTPLTHLVATGVIIGTFYCNKPLLLLSWALNETGNLNPHIKDNYIQPFKNIVCFVIRVPTCLIISVFSASLAGVAVGLHYAGFWELSSESLFLNPSADNQTI